MFPPMSLTLKELYAETRQLPREQAAELIPNQVMLINTIPLLEAKDSSEIENIVTTHDELYRDEASPESTANPAAKEVLRYRQALWLGFNAVRESGLLTNQHILSVQAELEMNKAGFRKVPGTALRDQDGRVIYTPPSPEHLVGLMSDLERFINTPESFDADPLTTKNPATEAVQTLIREEVTRVLATGPWA